MLEGLADDLAEDSAESFVEDPAEDSVESPAESPVGDPADDFVGRIESAQVALGRRSERCVLNCVSNCVLNYASSCASSCVPNCVSTLGCAAKVSQTPGRLATPRCVERPRLTGEKLLAEQD